jgi:peptidoglycan/xylan/chitin deacetylase (PgdA/CDA1 family)
MFTGKRELLARGLHRSGALLMLSQLPARDSLLVLNHHRIGNSEGDLFDPGVFSATADELDQQVTILKRRHALVTLEEALAFVDGTSKDRSRQCRVLITFDDGYLDNYKLAFPILQSHGVQGVFFLCTNLVGSNFVPWWDRIAYLLKTARRHRFSLSYPGHLAVNVHLDGLGTSLNAVLKLYKRPQNTNSARFIRELAAAAQGEEPPGTLRRFLNWDEAREMIRGGMAIGSHSQSHPVLSQLEPEKQRQELSESKAILSRELGIEVDTLAYPVGQATSFSPVTQKLAQEVGYRAAFSYYGGVNLPNTTTPYDINRVNALVETMDRFEVRTTVCMATGKFWP